jgi:hypothetical protein
MMRRLGVGLSIGFAFVLASAATSDRPDAAEQALARESGTPVTVYRDAGSRRPRLIHGSFVLPSPDREAAVRGWLRLHAALFHLDGDGFNLALASSREGLAGTYLRFEQRVDDLPVFGGAVVALARPDAGATQIRTVNLAQFDVARPSPRIASIDAATALQAVRAAVDVAGVPAFDQEMLLGIDPAPPQALAYRVRFRTVEPAGSWEAMVDARDGQVRSLRNRIVHVSGSGMVFDPSPIASTGDLSLVDNGDATSPALDAARYSVVLPRLDGSGVLRGSYVDAQPKQAAQRAFSAGETFEYDRSDDRFEEVMAYYHIDRAQDRIQSVLGFGDVDNRVQVAIVNASKVDNSFYDPAKKTIEYGSGGVDDAEDAEIVLHEYGHSIQDDQVPGYGGGDEGAMGEGFGDYFATSVSLALSHKITDPDCLGAWDASAYSASCLRRLDSSKHFPEHIDGEVHDDGEIWSAALAKSRATLGADLMDKLVIEAHFLLSANETFAAAVDAILASDQSLNAGADLAVLKKNFIEQGLSREISPAAPPTGVLQTIDVSVDNPRAGGIYDNGVDDSQTVVQQGAAALRLHFTQIQTELDVSCFGGACDNLYLYDAQGRLYQILNGSLGPTTSVAVPGDTVRVRLVSDFSVGLFGYHIDKVEVLQTDSIFANGFE